MIWLWIFEGLCVFQWRFYYSWNSFFWCYSFQWECVWTLDCWRWIFTSHSWGSVTRRQFRLLCHVCRFYTARLTDFFGFIYLFILQLFELIWFEFLNLTGCVYLCDFAGQEKWGIRYHICGCGRLKILKSNIKGELRLNFLSRSRQAWF